jgi:uncharacterized OB-fold protein
MAKKREMDTRFSKFGTVSFTAITKVNDFIDYLEEGSVMATRCTDCGMIFFPPRADCYRCLASNMEWVAVTGTGKLVTYSKLQYAPIGFGDDLPYAIALLDYGDYKVFGRIAASVPEDEIKIGMNMKTVANRLSDGRINYVFEKA